MRYIYLIVLMFLIVGCAPDPMRSAIAQERASQAAVAANNSNAQISQAQLADTDARNAQQLLQALQSQQAIVAGQAAIAQADAQTAIVASNNQALVLVVDRIAEASRTDYTPLYAVLSALVIVAVVWIVVNRRKPVAVQRLLFHSRHAEAWLMVDGTIQLCRLSDGKARVYVPGDEMYNKLLVG